MNGLPRFATFCVTLLTVLALGSGGLVFAARQNEPQSWTIFSGPDGDLCENACLFGIRPGITPLDDAERLIAQHPYTHKFNQTDVRDVSDQKFVSPEESRSIYFQVDDRETVSYVSLSFDLDHGVINFGETLALLGAPERTHYSSDEFGGVMILNFKSNLMLFGCFPVRNYKDPQFYPDAFVHSFSISTSPFYEEECGNKERVQYNAVEYPFWIGFGSLLRYAEHCED